MGLWVGRHCTGGSTCKQQVVLPVSYPVSRGLTTAQASIVAPCVDCALIVEAVLSISTRRWMGSQVGVPQRHLDVRVPQDLAQRRQGATTHDEPAGEVVAQIVEGEVLEPQLLLHGFPRRAGKGPSPEPAGARRTSGSASVELTGCAAPLKRFRYRRQFRLSWLRGSTGFRPHERLSGRQQRSLAGMSPSFSWRRSLRDRRKTFAGSWSTFSRASSCTRRAGSRNSNTGRTGRVALRASAARRDGSLTAARQLRRQGGVVG
jgi:hypothetical protein